MERAILLRSGDTLKEALAKLTRAFAAAGLPAPEIDARFLAQGVLGLTATDIFAAPNRPVGPDATRLEQAALRRLKSEPVARILGERSFYGRTFEVTPDVLDPRADTETVIEAALQVIEERGLRSRKITIADIGTGSGAILLTLLSELPLAIGIATDISPSALAVARRNGERHGVADRFKLIHTRGLEGVEVPVDIVVSNPPYIPSGDICRLAVDVRGYDPLMALDGGSDGLEIYREIARDIKAVAPPVAVILEVGEGQSADVERIFSRAGTAGPSIRTRHFKDLGGHVRCVTIEMEN